MAHQPAAGEGLSLGTREAACVADMAPGEGDTHFSSGWAGQPCWEGPWNPVPLVAEGPQVSVQACTRWEHRHPGGAPVTAEEENSAHEFGMIILHVWIHVTLGCFFYITAERTRGKLSTSIGGRQITFQQIRKQLMEHKAVKRKKLAWRAQMFTCILRVGGGLEWGNYLHDISFYHCSNDLTKGKPETKTELPMLICQLSVWWSVSLFAVRA